jgi:hypothetical protein
MQLPSLYHHALLGLTLDEVVILPGRHPEQQKRHSQRSHEK